MADHSTIKDNFIVDNTDGILIWKSGNAAEPPSGEVPAEPAVAPSPCKPILVKGNQLLDNTGSGIGVHSHSNALIQSNTVCNSGQSGVYFSDFATVLIYLKMCPWCISVCV